MRVRVKIPHLTFLATGIDLTGVALAWSPAAVLVEVAYESGRAALAWVGAAR